MNSSGNDDDAFADALKPLLRAAENEVDFMQSARLSAARARAVAAAEHPARLRGWLLRSAPVAAAVLVLLLVPRLQNLNRSAPHELTQTEVLETLSDDRVPAVSEDLDFYQWLAESDGQV